MMLKYVTQQDFAVFIIFSLLVTISTHRSIRKFTALLALGDLRQAFVFQSVTNTSCHYIPHAVTDSRRGEAMVLLFEG
jgi:hypothetical protein